MDVSASWRSGWHKSSLFRLVFGIQLPKVIQGGNGVADEAWRRITSKEELNRFLPVRDSAGTNTILHACKLGLGPPSEVPCKIQNVLSFRHIYLVGFRRKVNKELEYHYRVSPIEVMLLQGNIKALDIESQLHNSRGVKSLCLDPQTIIAVR